MKKIGLLTIIVLLLSLQFFSCGTLGGGSAEGTININVNEYRQVIDGFGGSNAWTGLPRDPITSNEVVKLLYSRTEGMGFTILRNRIPFRERLTGDDAPNVNDGFLVLKNDNTYDITVNADGTKTFNLNWRSWDLAGTKRLIEEILDLGDDGPEKLVLFSSPWTTPNNRVTQWKEDVTGIGNRDGKVNWAKPDVWGRLKKDKYADYADLLADYAKNFEANMGAPLSILSVQNEPNWKTDYESTYWSGTDLRDFLVVMEQRFPRKGVRLGEGGLGVMIPEFENFGVNYNEMIKPSIDAPAAEKILTHIALHQYNGAFDSTDRAGAKAFPEITATEKKFWQTEVSGSVNNIPTEKTGINNALYYARMIHYDFTLTQMNAFLYWWLWNNDSRESSFPGALVNIEDGETIVAAKRLYAMGQFSRFIRPGWRRIESDTSPKYGIYSSAYRNPDSNEIAIVLINDRTSAYTVELDLTGAEFEELNYWRTSEKENLMSLGRQRTSANKTTVTLPPKSITTYYGKIRS